MHIDQIVKTNRKREVRLSARVRMKNGDEAAIYFSAPGEYGRCVAGDATPFLPLMLLVAMRTGEDLTIEGSVSQGLMKTVPQIMQTLADWEIGYRPVRVVPQKVIPDKKSEGAVGSFFSGGVDSFYTFLKHSKNNDRHDPVEYLIFVRGYDIDVGDEEVFRMVHAHLKAAADGEGVQLGVVATNIREFADRYVDWHSAVSAGLASAGLFLGRGFRKLFIAASDTADHLLPSPSHPHIDPLWSTDSLAFVHDGIEASRIEKIRTIVGNSATAMHHVRVCYKNGGGRYNCGRCSKCLMTMIELRAAQMLDRVKTLPHHIDPREVRLMVLRSRCASIHVRTSLGELKKMSLDPPLQAALADLLKNTDQKSLGRRIRDAVRRIDGTYNHYRLYKFLSRRGIIN